MPEHLVQNNGGDIAPRVTSTGQSCPNVRSSRVLPTTNHHEHALEQDFHDVLARCHAVREEELHWALVATHISDKDIKGYASWQAIDRHDSDGRLNPVVWELHHSPDVRLHQDAKCLGGVNIGQLKGQDVKRLNKVR